MSGFDVEEKICEEFVDKLINKNPNIREENDIKCLMETFKDTIQEEYFEKGSLFKIYLLIEYGYQYDITKDKIPFDYTSCTICLEDFNDYQILNTMHCFHTFHEKCYERLRSIDFDNENKLPCPVCRNTLIGEARRTIILKYIKRVYSGYLRSGFSQ